MKKQGFTLTEILITLTIIGVIAALTIPNLMTSVGKSKTKTQLLKLESELNQAIQLYENNGGSLSGVLNTATATKDAFASVMMTSYVGTKSFTTKYANGGAMWTNYVREDMLLKNGIDIFAFQVNNGSTCTGLAAHDCMHIYVDLNGLATGPNTIASDIFNFSIVKDPTSGIFSVEPFGTQSTHSYNPTINVNARCAGAAANGHGCASELLNGL